MNISFKLTEEQRDRALAWWKDHDCPAKKAWLTQHGNMDFFPGPFGGGYSWVLSPTTVGDYICIKCDCDGCDANLRDITDLANNY